MYIDKKLLLDFINDRINSHEIQMNNSNIPATIENNSGALSAINTLKGFIEQDVFSQNDYEDFLLRRGYDPDYSLNGQKPSILRMVYYKLYFLIRNK